MSPISLELDIEQTEEAINFVKHNFSANLSRELELLLVTAPLFVLKNSRLADVLTGVERMVSFTTKAGLEGVVNQSLAKWKRMALAKYKFKKYKGLYTNMNAIRIDEELSPLHSYFVDQWDWEMLISREDRNDATLEKVVRKIFQVLKQTENMLIQKYPMFNKKLPDDISFFSAQYLEDIYPDLTPKEREYAISKKYGCVFIKQIGKILKSGNIHDKRSPDYDDWDLNGDIIVYSKHTDEAIELSSMGIRVDEKSMEKQLRILGNDSWMQSEFHKNILNGTYPLTIGGGIGQSRLCMFLLEKRHIGEVQVSIWPDDVIDKCREEKLLLL